MPFQDITDLSALEVAVKDNDKVFAVVGMIGDTDSDQTKAMLDEMLVQREVEAQYFWLDIGKVPDVLKNLNLQNYPATLVYENGKEVVRQIGALTDWEQVGADFGVVRPGIRLGGA